MEDLIVNEKRIRTVSESIYLGPTISNDCNDSRELED